MGSRRHLWDALRQHFSQGDRSYRFEFVVAKQLVDSTGDFGDKLRATARQEVSRTSPVGNIVVNEDVGGTGSKNISTGDGKKSKSWLDESLKMKELKWPHGISGRGPT